MKQYCIVGTGRSGSSLLASIMAQSGADFSLDTVTDWDSVKDSMEHPLASQAFSYIHKIHTIEKTLVPGAFFRSFFEKKLKQTLVAMCDIPYIKASKLVYVVPHLAKLNPDMKIIIVYRKFADYARSRHSKYGWDMDRLQSEYVNAYSTALLQMSIWGGVTISYEDVVASENHAWADALEQCTGLNAQTLIQNRNKILKKPSAQRSDEEIYFSKEVLAVQKKLQMLQNTSILSSK